MSEEEDRAPGAMAQAEYDTRAVDLYEMAAQQVDTNAHDASRKLSGRIHIGSRGGAAATRRLLLRRQVRAGSAGRPGATYPPYTHIHTRAQTAFTHPVWKYSLFTLIVTVEYMVPMRCNYACSTMIWAYGVL